MLGAVLWAFVAEEDKIPWELTSELSHEEPCVANASSQIHLRKSIDCLYWGQRNLLHDFFAVVSVIHV